MSTIRVGKLKLGVNFAGNELFKWTTQTYTVASIPVSFETYQLLDIVVKENARLISRTPVNFGSQDYYAQSYMVQTGWAAAVSIEGANELVPHGDGRTMIEVFGRTSGPTSNPEGYGNIAFNDFMKNKALIAGSWPIKGRYKTHTSKKISIKDEYLELDKVTGIIKSREIDISAAILNAVTRRAWYEQFQRGQREYKSELKFGSPSDVSSQPDPNKPGDSKYEVSAIANMTVPSAFTWEQEIDIYYNTDTETLSLEISAEAGTDEEAMFAYIKERNHELSDIAIRRGYGEDVKVDVDTPHPEFDVDGVHAEQYEEFKNSFDIASKRVNDIVVGAEVDLIKQLEPDITPEQLQTRKDELVQKAATAESGTSVWGEVWDSVKSVAGWAGDTVREWGPVGMVGAYAGYETVKAAKRENMLVWIALGLGALVILK